MSQDTGANRPVSPVIAGATTNKDRTLLIADDDAAFRNRIARALELRGFIVTSVGSVAEALAQTARPPAFAVLDLRLGDGNGLRPRNEGLLNGSGRSYGADGLHCIFLLPPAAAFFSLVSPFSGFDAKLADGD